MSEGETYRVLQDATLEISFGKRSIPAAEALKAANRRGRGFTVAREHGRTVVAPGSNAVAHPSQRALSLWIRIGDPATSRLGELLCEYAPDERPRYSLSLSEKRLLFELYTDYRNEPLQLQSPIPSGGGDGRHDVIACYSGHHLQLFLDGDLADEDWPVGALWGEGRSTIVIGARGRGTPDTADPGRLVEELVVWDRALSEQEIEYLGGGSKRAERSPETATHTPPPQYRESPGGGCVGDCLPFFHDGVYHFYYLFDRRNHRSKFGLGAHQWAHSSSSDLLHWTHHPHAIPITDEREGSICTGSVFFHDGTWYGFYATRLLDRTEHLSLATSRDGIHFTKNEPNPIASPEPPYRSGPFRDPFVFRDPSDGLFHMLMTAELESPAVERRGGCLAHLVSADLRRWEQREPFLVTGYADQPECSELFEWHGWYYLVFSHFGAAHYRFSRNLFGPWEKPPVDTFDGPQARVMKSAPFTGDRRIGAAFLDKGRGYAGRAVFREYLQRTDGTLATRWPPEMIPRTGPPVSLSTPALAEPSTKTATESAGKSAASFVIDAPDGFAAVDLGLVPRDILLRFEALPGPGTLCFGVGIRGRENLNGALMLEVDPGRRKIGWRRAEDPSWRECESAALYEVNGFEKLTQIAVVALDETFDVCVNDERTLISRHAADTGGDHLFFYCHNGGVALSSVVVQPILSR